LAHLTTRPHQAPNGRVAHAAPLAAPPRRSRGWGWWRTLLWRLSVSTLIFLAVLELGLRALDLGHPYESEPESYLPVADADVLFTLKPGYRGFSEGTDVAISQQGLRDREFAIPKPASTFRLLALGDSVTFGFGVLGEQTFSKQLEQRLNALGESRTYEVLNGGVIGYNTIQERARLERIGLHFQPDAVVLMFLVNDMLDTFSIFDHQYEPTDRLAPLKKWLRRNSRLYRFYQNVTWRLQAAFTKDPDRPEQARDRQRLEEREAEILRINQISREHGVRFFLAIYPDNLNQQVTPNASGRSMTVREELLGFAQRNSLPVLDLSDAIGDVNDPRARQMRLREDPHPSPAGHQAIANALLPALQSAGILGQ
jgi:lysophospholipase L1-like esterase